MMKYLYLFSVVFYVTAGCDLSGAKKKEITRHGGGSVLLPCSCSDLHTKPQLFTWMTYRTGYPTDVLNDEHYRGRLQLFNNTSPGNLSLLISDLREKDHGDYRCSTEKEYRDIRINVKVGRRETSTRSGKTDRRTQSVQPSRKTPQKQGTCGENGITEGRPDCKGKSTDQPEPDLVTFCIK